MAPLPVYLPVSRSSNGGVPRERDIMKRNRFGLSVLVSTCLVLLLFFLPACFDTGPTLSVVVPEHSLQSTLGVDTQCCCLVVGTAINQSTVPVQATLKFTAFEDGDSSSVGTAFEFLRDMQPGEQRSFSASGLVMPCSDIDRYELLIDLTGSWLPPS